MKTVEQWAQELPASFREEVLSLFCNKAELMEAETIGQFLSLIMGKFDNFISSKNDWEELTRAFMHNQDKQYHVSYWIAQDLSAGLTVRALNMQHAEDIVCYKTQKDPSQIICVQSLDSEFKERNTEDHLVDAIKMGIDFHPTRRSGGTVIIFSDEKQD